MQAIIYKPVKSASQSANLSSQKWILKTFSSGKYQEKLMGWIGSDNINDQIILHFENLKDATSYAQKQNILYMIHYPNKRSVKLKSYAENFVD